jgi:hypothetical protein
VAYIQPIPNEFCGDVKSMENASRISRFRSKKTKLDPKAKELLTKFRKGMIWKEL